MIRRGLLVDLIGVVEMEADVLCCCSCVCVCSPLRYSENRKRITPKTNLTPSLLEWLMSKMGVSDCLIEWMSCPTEQIALAGTVQWTLT